MRWLAFKKNFILALGLLCFLATALPCFCTQPAHAAPKPHSCCPSENAQSTVLNQHVCAHCATQHDSINLETSANADAALTTPVVLATLPLQHAASSHFQLLAPANLCNKSPPGLLALAPAYISIQHFLA